MYRNINSNMKNFKSILVLSLALGTFTGVQAAKLTFKVTNPVEKAKVILTFGESGDSKEVAIDAAGNGSIEINGFTPQYVTMQYTRGRRTLYLDPKHDLTLIFNSADMWKATTFQGPGAAINTYLGSGKIKSLGMPDMKLSESKLIQRGDSLYTANCEVLETAKLPQEFTAKEKVRLQYYSYYYFPMYASYHGYVTKNTTFVPSAAYYEKLKGMVTIDSDLLSLKEYKSFLPVAISALSAKGSENDDDNTATKSVNYVDANVKDPQVAEFLVDNYVYDYVDNNGVDNADALIALYHKHVKDAAMNENFKTLCTSWEKLRAGNPSLAFTYTDIDGKSVSSADLKGKFVYIDVWATWCGPCRGELPSLKKLEEAYAGKDIHFLSLSCDKDKKAWENMVKKDELKGIQLHMGGDRAFMEAYRINGIPRFILLDRDGNIISANMSRPSSAKTAAKFDELLKL